MTILDCKLRQPKPHTRGKKRARDLTDHDVIVGHGLVDWVTGLSAPLADHVLAHVHSNTAERGSYTLCIPNDQILSYERW